MIVRTQNYIPQVKVISFIFMYLEVFGILKIKRIKGTTLLGNCPGYKLHWPLICLSKVVHISLTLQIMRYTQCYQCVYVIKPFQSQ